MSTRTRALAFACAVLTIALVLGTAVSALARPTEPTMGLSELQSLLDTATAGQVGGYFKTVVRGQEITSTPVIIQGITPGSRTGTYLILFQATDLAKYGGIVAGMSGSPIYVENGGVEKIVGAVSYGNYFSINGAGLATPIDSMSALENLSNGPDVMPLRQPMLSAGKVVNKVIIADDPQDYAGAAAAGAFVAKPLASVFIGGLNANGRAYKALSARLAKRGVAVATLDGPPAGLPGDLTAHPATELTAGASVAALASRGEMWVGGIGTVTYSNEKAVVAFGHPMFWDGASHLYMSNAWIDGVWPSTYDAYKMGSPTITRGTFTQDRNAGILGKVSVFPTETIISAEATDTDTGVATSTVSYVPRALLNSGSWDGTIVSAAAAVAAEKLVDKSAFDGSAQTTTTIHVADGDHNEYLIQIANLYDSPEVDWDVTEDIYNAVGQLQAALDNGTETLDIESVDLQMSFTSTHRSAQIAGIRVDGGLHAGDNTATVTYVVHGQKSYVETDVPFSIPATMALSGELRVSSSDGYNYAPDSQYTDSSLANSGGGSSSDTTPGPISGWITTVADAVGYANSTQTYNQLLVSYRPYASTAATSATLRTTATESTSTTPWYLSGYQAVASPYITTALDPTIVEYRDTAEVMGDVRGTSSDITVTIYGQVVGETDERLLGTTKAMYDAENETSSFDTMISDLPATTVLRFHTDASESSLSSDVTQTVRVRAYTRLSASPTTLKKGKTVTLKATVLSKASAGSSAAFQYYDSSPGKWRTISTKVLASSAGAARASATWKPGKGVKKVRVRFLGGPANASANSNTVKITVK